MLRLFTFGGLGLETDDGSAAPHLRRPQLAVLAVLAAAGDRGVSRERLANLFWADSDEEHARHSARQVLYALRQELGADVVRSGGSTLKLEVAFISSDVTDFRTAIAAGDRSQAVQLAKGQFLDGFYLPGAAAFERWVEEERGRLASAKAAALLSLATDAARAADLEASVDWWRQLTSLDPLSGRYAVGYLKALAARGDRAEALAFAKQHEVVMRRELESEADPDVKRIEAELRSMPVSTAPSNGSGNAVPLPATNGNAPHPHPAEAAQQPVITLRSRALLIPRIAASVAVLLVLAVTAAFARDRGWLGPRDPAPTFAVGRIRDDVVQDSLRQADVMTDMLATNLARVNGLRILSNSRLLELMPPRADLATRYADAARRAGATELIEGRMYVEEGRLNMELSRVELRSGIVRAAYRATATSRHALVDSVTRIMANDLGMVSPSGSVADATTTSLIAYRFYEEGLRAYYAGDATAARRLMRAALLEDSTFAMAAWYEARLAAGGRTPDGRSELEARATALRLATGAPERERLTITADVLVNNNDPRAVTVAESLTARYPYDARALLTLSHIRTWSGDWSRAADAAQRAIALDSAATAGDTTRCGICDDLVNLAGVYSWWDSMPAAVRATQRLLSAAPENPYGFELLTFFALRNGDTAVASDAYRRRNALQGVDPVFKFRYDLFTEAYDEVERDVGSYLASPKASDRGEAYWAYFMALRNQGRLRHARLLARTGWFDGLPQPPSPHQPSAVFDAIVALDMGDARAAMLRYEEVGVTTGTPAGVRARDLAWRGVRIGMAAAYAGDTARARAYADSVERWGSKSLYGRDQRLHHFLRGRLQAMAGHHADAVREYQAAIHSRTLGFTRVNLEMARSHLALAQSQDAIAILQAAMRGVLDASNLYVSRTELHELLAESFVQAKQVDSATTHYQAVVKGWERADQVLQPRRARAADWLARHAPASRIAAR